jgi:hypothetical protein
VDIDAIDRRTGVKVPIAGDATNALGFYTIVLTPGSYKIDFEPDPSLRLVPLRLDDVRVEETSVRSVELAEGWVVTGTALARHGAPVAGIDADLIDLSTGREIPIVDDETGDDGEFNLVVETGSYALTLAAPVETRLVTLAVPELIVNGDATMSFELDPGVVVRGTVSEGERRTPLASADLDFLRRPEGREIATAADRTDALGRYAVVVPPGDYDVVAIPPVESGWDPDTTRANIVQDLVLDFRFGGGADVTPVAPVVLPAFPNPTSSTATIPLRVDLMRGPVTARIYDVQGRVVRDLFSGTLPAATISIEWDGRDEAGRRVAAGVYFVRVAQQGRTNTARLLMVPPRQ